MSDNKENEEPGEETNDREFGNELRFSQRANSSQGSSLVQSEVVKKKRGRPFGSKSSKNKGDNKNRRRNGTNGADDEEVRDETPINRMRPPQTDQFEDGDEDSIAGRSRKGDSANKREEAVLFKFQELNRRGAVKTTTAENRFMSYNPLSS